MFNSEMKIDTRTQKDVSIIYPYLKKAVSVRHTILHHQNYTFKYPHTPLLNGPISKNREQRRGILHIVRDP